MIRQTPIPPESIGFGRACVGVRRPDPPEPRPQRDAFYERLGFRNAGDPPGQWRYLILRRGSIELHFYPGTGEASRCFD
jgi:hypothetical protein